MTETKPTWSPDGGLSRIYCPHCGAWTEILESRLRPTNWRYRRYQCANMHRFTTEERVRHEAANNQKQGPAQV